MAREWLLRGVDPEELKRETIEIPETPRGKWENFWYHYKWTFWGGAFLVVVLGVILCQSLFRDDPDYRFLLLTKDSYYISQQIDYLENMLAQYGEDLDGDGKVEVNIQNCQYDMDADLTHNSGLQLVNAHLAAGDVLFFMCDKSTVKTFTGNVTSASNDGADFLSDIAVDSEGVLVDGDNPEDEEYPYGQDKLPDGKVYTWKNNPGLTEDVKAIFPENLYFMMRAPSGSAAQATDLHSQSMALLQRFIEDTKTAE